MASTKKTSAPGKTVQDEFRVAAAAVNDPAKWDAAKRALVTAIRACTSVAELEKLLRSSAVSEAFFGEAVAWPEVADALVALAQSLSDPKEAARGLGWLSRGCGFDPSAIVRPDLSPELAYTRKPGFADAVSSHRAVFRQWLADSSPERRSAAAIALAYCANTTSDDAHALLALCGREKNASALASALLSLGVAFHRQKGTSGIAPEDVRALAMSKVDDKNALVRLAGAAVLALSRLPLATDALGVLLEHAQKGVALPVEWGWHVAQPPALKSDSVALSLLCFAPLAQVGPAVAALFSVSPGKYTLGFVELLSDALVHVAFTARGRPLPRVVFTPADADEIERGVADLFRREPWSRSTTGKKKLGLPRESDQIAALLAGKALDYRAMPVSGLVPERAWHFARVWAAVVFGELSCEAGVATLSAACSHSEAIALVMRHSHAKAPAYEQIETEQQWQRHFQLALAVIGCIGSDGFDVTGALAGLESDPLVDSSLLAAAYLTEYGAELPSEKVALIARGLSAARSLEPLQQLLRELPEPARCAVLQKTTIGGNSLRFMKLCLSQAVVQGLLFFATGPWGSEFGDQVLDVLAQGDGTTIAFLESVTYPNEDRRAASASFLGKAIERLRSRRPGT